MKIKSQPVSPFPNGYDKPASWFHIPEQYRDTWRELAPDVDTSLWPAVVRTMCLAEMSEQRSAPVRNASVRQRSQAPDFAPPLKHASVTQQTVTTAPAQLDSQPTSFQRAAAFGTPLEGLPMWALIDPQGTERQIRAHEMRDAAGYRSRAEHAIRARAILVAHDTKRAHEKRVQAAKIAVACPVCGDTATGFPIQRSLVESFTKQGAVEARIAQEGCAPIPELTSCGKCFEVAKAIYVEELRAERLLVRGGRDRESLVRAAAFPQRLGLGGD